jgi:exopolysaccharide/PEP-CTERM locus tyrosine autokinase
MERARTERGEQYVPVVGQEGFEPSPKKPEAPRPAPGHPLQGIRYTTTRTVELDTELLERNHILTSASGDTYDSYRMLRTQVLQRTKPKRLNSLMVTSASPGEGKTVTAVNLAMSMAHEMRQTALLVDANLRRPKVDDYLGLGQSDGLFEYALGHGEIADYMVNPSVPKFTVLPAGHPHGGGAELLNSPRVLALANELKSRYADRYVIYDCPHLLGMPDALMFAEQADGIILVVAEGKTERDDVMEALELLEGRTIIGIVLNKTRRNA